MSRRTRRRLAACIPVIALVALTATWFMVPPYAGKLDEYPASATIRDRRGHILRVTPDAKGLYGEAIPLDQMGTWTAKALVAAEDKRFHRHAGVDAVAVCRAVFNNITHGRIVSGASTLTMLVAKLTEPRPRTLWTKLVEAKHALGLETRLTKEQILEQYLNRAPFGGTITGIETASLRYFGKSSADLNLSEAALLVGIPQAPSRLHPDAHMEAATRRRNTILERMKECGFITEGQFRQATAQAHLMPRRSTPFLAPHFCDMVSETYPHRFSLATSLDLALQRTAERSLRAGLDSIQPRVHGGAVVVMEVSTGKIRALVGSPGYADQEHNGQVNGATSRRSPGSTLKPFIYAMAFDDGMLSPHAVLADIPVDFGGYKPENFNRDYCGPVSARFALVHSLNIPALTCVRKIGLNDIVRRLREAGVSTLDRRADHYGLSIAIGTCEVTLVDMVTAYATFARGGLFQEMSFLEQDAPRRETRLFTAEAAYLVSDILGGDERASEAGGHIADARLPRIAWKTGTSSGNRDAWCIGYNPEYVVGVWVGNPSGRSAETLTGSSEAAPIVHGIFRVLYPDGNAPWFMRPPGLKSRLVCSLTGCLPGSWCPGTVTDDYIPGVTATRACGVHRLVAAGDVEEVREIWPDEIASFLTSSGSGKAYPAKDTQAVRQTPSPARTVLITSPCRNATFRLVEGNPCLKQELVLSARTVDEGTVFWFIDGQLFKTVENNEPASWSLIKGRHLIACSNSSGIGDSIEITIE